MFRPGKNFQSGKSDRNSAADSVISQSLSNFEKGGVSSFEQLETAEINSIASTISGFPPVSASSSFKENLRQQLASQLGLL